MAADQGISHLIDIGSGLPVRSNTHGVVQNVIPWAHVVYVDNDPEDTGLADSDGSHWWFGGVVRRP
jgi:hypothetical protein